MKKIQVTLLFCFLLTSAWSQIRLGVKAGIYSNDLDVSTIEIDKPGLRDKFKLALEEANYGIQLGVQIRAYLGERLLLQPELLFNSNTVEFTTEDLDDPQLADRIFEESYQYLDIPVLIGWDLGPLRIQAGPTGHLYLDSSSELFDFENYDQNFNDLTIGYQFGLGLDLWGLTVDVRREGNFTKFGSHIRFGDSRFQFDQAPSRWLFQLGYVFGQRR